MTGTINRADRRCLERRIKRLLSRIEENAARVELVELTQQLNARVTYQGSFSTGADFALCVTPDGLRYGERDTDGFCSFEVYGPGGGHLYGYGGDSYDLEAEVNGQYETAE